MLAGGFLAQRGRDAVPQTTRTLDEAVTIDTATRREPSTEGVMGALADEPVTVWTGVHLPPPGQYDRLIVYLALHQQHMVTLTAPGSMLPGALRAWGRIYATVHDGTIAHLSLRPSNGADREGHHEVGVLAYGPDAAGTAAALADDVRAWEQVRDVEPAFDVHLGTEPDAQQHDAAVILKKRHSLIRATWPVRTGPEIVEMRLLEAYFDLIASGQKTIELRCADAKRSAITPATHIRFTCGTRHLVCKVLRASRYDSFEALYEAEDPASINPHTSKAEQLAGIKTLYGPEKLALGAVALEIEVIADQPGPVRLPRQMTGEV